MSAHEIEATFGKRTDREQRNFSVSPTGHVVVDLGRLFSSEEVRRRLIKVAHQLHQEKSSSK